MGNLTAAQRQSVEIAKSLSHNGRILILDKPTSSLSEREVRTLFTIIAELKAQGVSIEVLLEVEGLLNKELLKDISFSVREGEILGIAGLVGAGRTELA
ncbi:hypothetical protein [Bacillus sp. UNC41MFS5]|uniref:hypothetical protein n=1 Tax=Bacillus sp. UNC41MFS5 TaxID=1449046 RepID=UPI000690FDF4|nr:hypothetical protein [Bacillus sp. UNC41MFS5]